MSKDLIRLEKIDKIYHMGDNTLKVLDQVSLTIEKGDFVAIMGPSGSGKSTLLNLIGTLDIATSGQYFFDEKDISTLNEDELALFRRHELGFIFQQFNLLSNFDAAENVALPLLYSQGSVQKEKAQPYLKSVGLDDRSDHLPREMSGGQQQRVAIARALMNDPRLILADEPTGNLDSHSEEQVMGILEKLNASGMTVVIVTHEDEIGERCKRIVRMRDGKILSDKRNRPHEYSPSAEKALAENKHTTLTITEHFKQGLKQLAANKIRTFLSVLGVLIGVASVVTMLAIGKGAQQAIESQLSSLGANILSLRAGAMRSSGVASEAGATAVLYPEDAEAIKAKFPSVTGTSPNINGRSQINFKNNNWNTLLMGVTDEYQDLRASKPSEGRFFTDEENKQRARVAIIGATVQRELFNGKNPIGETIRINKNNFLIIGLLPEKGSGGFRDQDDVVIVPLQTAMRRVFGRTVVDSIDIQIDKMADMKAAEEEILNFVIKRHHVPPSQEEDAFMIYNMADIQQAISSSGKTMTLLLTVIAAISLLVGGIGIMNIMLVSVTERTREIGLRKAIGATSRDILTQFLVESAVVGIVGGLAGILTGVVLALILTFAAGWDTSISPLSIIVSFFFSFLIGVIFGVYPARSASKLHPIDALRSD